MDNAACGDEVVSPLNVDAEEGLVLPRAIGHVFHHDLIKEHFSILRT